ncbi:MAG: Long chronological lifespan protein 2 [Cirrosporium novae-zelandiae]|nr:MAG: Long chronological lifespan protein 2 [Cirrosporium novae-zelandiae]
MRGILQFLFSIALLLGTSQAQFQGFFEQMFSGGQQHQQQQGNAPSDSSIYQQQYESARCSNYLCPGTLACVHFPHHCPCAWPAHEDKVELGEGSAICISKGGWQAGEAARKIELARKGFL